MPFRHSIAAFAVALIWGLNFVVIKVGLHDLPPLLFSALRFAVAAVPVMFFWRGPGVSWALLISIGLVLGVVKFSLLFTGIDLGAGAGLASLLLQAQVFITTLLAAVLYGERPSKLRIGGLILGAVGIIVIGSTTLGETTGGSVTVIGFVLILAAAAAWSVSNILMRRLTSVNLVRFMSWMSLVPILPLLILSAILEGPQTMIHALQGLTWVGGAAILYVSLAATVIGFAVWGFLLSRYPAAQVTPFALLVPVAGMAGGSIFLGEEVSLPELAGALLIFAGLGLTVFGDRILRLLRPAPSA